MGKIDAIETEQKRRKLEQRNMSRFELVVLLEHSDGFHVWSRHRSRDAADRSFREVIRQWPGDRVIFVDLTNGMRQQCDRDGTLSVAFKAPIYTGGRYVWTEPPSGNGK